MSAAADDSPTIRQALTQARTAGLERLEAQRLLGHVVGQPRTWLASHDDQLLTAATQSHWNELLARRLAGEPLAYLTGHHEFHGLDLQVSPAVLDPRADTETLVDWGLELLARLGHPSRVLDLGTGSGAIALAIKHRCPSAQVTAVDLSPAALAVARENGRRLQLDVDWQAGSWFDPLPGQRFDLIVSNPPYIAEGDPHLAALQCEPQMALVSGEDGLRDIRTLIHRAPRHLAAGAWLLLEHGYDQGAAVRDLLSTGGFVDLDARHDLAGHLRCSGGRWPGTQA